jgi:hypothetical protein
MRFAPQGPSTSREKLPNGSALAAKARVAVRRDSKLINVLLVDGVAVLPRLDNDDDCNGEILVS